MTDASATVTAVAAPTIVWALPLGHWRTHQQMVSRQVLGAGAVVVGLAMFVLVETRTPASTARQRAAL